MNNLRPYSKYKPSGIAWLGDIPEHWDLRKGKKIWKKEQRPIREIDDIVTAFRNGVVTLRKNRRNDGFTIALKEIGYQGVRKGDLVIHQMDAFAGAIGVSDSDGKCTPVYSVCTPIHDASSYFYNYLLKEMSRSQFILSLTQGIRERSSDFRFNMFGELVLPLPSTSEQTAIATFLDYKTAKIDRFIHKKKQLIKLLNEQKAGIINHAVTQGLNPNATTKPSGIEWLGDIPEHWEIVKLRYLARITTGNKNTEDRVENGQYDFFVRSQKIAKINSYSFDGEGILTAGDGVGVGKVFHYINGKCDYHQRVYLFYKFTNKVHVKYLFYFLQKFLKNELMIYNAKSTVDSVRLPVLKDFLVVLPSVPEQTAIVSHIETETAIINKTIATIEKEIALVQEYRTALIAEAVTGKIDVRDYTFSTIEDEETYEEWEEELNIAAEDEAEYNKQEAE